MKHIYLNLKRFDVPVDMGGVNRLAPVSEWGETIVKSTQQFLRTYDPADVEFVQFFPEMHLLSAIAAKDEGCPLRIGCQGVYRSDVRLGGNFGTFTANRPAKAMQAAGCTDVLIGHCEERADKRSLLTATGASADTAESALNGILNEEIQAAQADDMRVLYCIGESDDQVESWQAVLGKQLEQGLRGVDMHRVVIAYEPIWSIGPGKTPADRSYIEKVARFIKARTDDLAVVYGGGLKAANAKMLASIPEIDGGLIALTRFNGEIGFYPEEYGKIVSLYLQNTGERQ